MRSLFDYKKNKINSEVDNERSKSFNQCHQLDLSISGLSIINLYPAPRKTDLQLKQVIGIY